MFFFVFVFVFAQLALRFGWLLKVQKETIAANFIASSYFSEEDKG